MVSTVSGSETRWESNVSRARDRSSAETVNVLLCLREARRRETWHPACCLADAREDGEEDKARSKERYQRRRSKLLLTRMSIAGLSVSITPEG